MPTTEPTEAPEKHSEFFDFDAWYADHVQATIPFKILGQTWDIPGDCDAALLLKLQRIEQWVMLTSIDPETPLPDGLTDADIKGFSPEGMARAFVGDQLVDAWFEAGIKAEMFRWVAKRLYAIYAGRDADAAMGLGKPQAAPKRPQDRKKKADQQD